MLYLENAKKRVSNLFSSEFRRSRAFPLVILAIVLIIPGGIWYAHTHAFFHRTKEKITDAPAPAASTGPGGRDPILIERSPTPGATTPEFVSAQVLPGLGLDLAQISAQVPGKGAVPLLVLPSLQSIADGTAPRSGPNDVHGAIEVPWGGLLTGLRNIVGTSLMLDFQGSTMTVPTDGKGIPISAEGGLLTDRNADSAELTTIPGGARLTGLVADSDFDGHWRSKSQVQVQIDVQATSVELTTTVKNTGEEATPMGIGWHPRFRLAGDRSNVELRLPQGRILEIVERNRELPTGRIVAAGETLARFFGALEPLHTSSLDDALVDMKPSGAAGLSAELRDPAAGYGLRITALSSSIGELRVYAPAGGDFVSLGFQTNFDNPLGHFWTPENPAIVVLQPGQTLQYKIRLEIFPLSGHPAR